MRARFLCEKSATSRAYASPIKIPCNIHKLIRVSKFTHEKNPWPHRVCCNFVVYLFHSRRRCASAKHRFRACR